MLHVCVSFLPKIIFKDKPSYKDPSATSVNRATTAVTDMRKMCKKAISSMDGGEGCVPEVITQYIRDQYQLHGDDLAQQVCEWVGGWVGELFTGG